MLTGRGASTLLAIMVFSFASWLTSNPTFIIASLTLVLIFLIETFRLNSALSAVRTLDMKREIMDSKLEVGGRTEVVVRLSNLTSRATGYLVVNDEVPMGFTIDSGMPRTVSLSGLEDTRVTYSVRAVQMGDYEFDGLSVVAIDALGLFSFTVHHTMRSRVQVYPHIPAIRTRGGSQAIRTTIIGQKPINESGLSSDFRGIREYFPGDDFKHIAWKAVARSARHSLMTREFESNRTLSIVLALHEKRSLLDGPLGHRKLDYVIEGILAATYAATSEEDRIALAFGRRIMPLTDPGHSKGHQLVHAVESTYNLKPMQDERFQTLAQSLLENVRRRSLIIAITDTENYDSLDFRALGQLLRLNIVRVIVMRTSSLFPKPAVNDHVVEIAYDLVLGREKRAIERMAADCGRLGIQLKVCNPQQFTKTVFEIYLDAKKKGVIVA